MADLPLTTLPLPVRKQSTAGTTGQQGGPTYQCGEWSTLTSTVEPSRSISDQDSVEEVPHLLSPFTVRLCFIVEPQGVSNLHRIASIGESDCVTALQNDFLQPHFTVIWNE